MDILGNIQKYSAFIVLALALVAIQFLLRRGRDPVKNQLELVQDLATEVRLDARMAEVLKSHPSPQPFVTTQWQLHNKQYDFLDKALQKNILDAFTLAQEYNEKIIAARKAKDFSSLTTLDIGKLTHLLDSCKEGLEQWMLLKVGSRNPPIKGPSIMDTFLGKR